MKRTALIFCLGLAAILSSETLVSAQNQGEGQRGDRNRREGGPGGAGGEQRRWDPAQARERMMDFYKEQLEITDDTEWKAIQPLVGKVMEARMATVGGMFGGMGRGFGGRPGGGGDDRGGRNPFGQPNPEVEALQRAVDGKASSSELKAALTRYTEARKTKQAELEKAQADLRKVLSARQEAIATLRGLL